MTFGQVMELWDPLERQMQDTLKQLEKARASVNRLRGRIGETCDTCQHATYCRNRPKYENNVDWILGCQLWEQESRTDKDDITRWIGKVL